MKKSIFNFAVFILIFSIYTNAQTSTKIVIGQFRDGENYPSMIMLRSGNFMMGIDESEAVKENIPEYSFRMDMPMHKVYVKKFAISKYDITVKEYAQFAKETGLKKNGCEILGSFGWRMDNSASWENPGFKQSENDPVVCVSWEDAQEYINWLNEKLYNSKNKEKNSIKLYRLPSGAEWEYAAKAGTTTMRYWGGEKSKQCIYANGRDISAEKKLNKNDDPNDVAPCSDGYVYTSPVGSFLPNAWGLYDMLGNVEQWTEDCSHFDYENAPNNSKPWISFPCEKREVRGGAWSTIPRGIISSDHDGEKPDRRTNYIGFRVVKDF